jgi:hypothetical protein
MVQLMRFAVHCRIAHQGHRCLAGPAGSLRVSLTPRFSEVYRPSLRNQPLQRFYWAVKTAEAVVILFDAACTQLKQAVESTSKTVKEFPIGLWIYSSSISFRKSSFDLPSFC